MPGPVSELVRTLLGFAETRARIAAGEIEEQWLRSIEILLWLAVAGFFLGVALVFLSVLVVLAAWDANRLLAAGLLGALYLAAALAAAVVARRRLRERPRFLAATLEELAKDRARVEPPA